MYLLLLKGDGAENQDQDLIVREAKLKKETEWATLTDLLCHNQDFDRAQV